MLCSPRWQSKFASLGLEAFRMLCSSAVFFAPCITSPVEVELRLQVIFPTPLRTITTEVFSLVNRSLSKHLTKLFLKLLILS